MFAVFQEFNHGIPHIFRNRILPHLAAYRFSLDCKFAHLGILRIDGDACRAAALFIRPVIAPSTLHHGLVNCHQILIFRAFEVE